MNNSLRFRIVLLLSLSSFAAIILLAFSMHWVFERAVERSLDAHLAAYTDLLVDELSIDGSSITINSQSSMFANVPRHWQVASEGKVLFKSQNLTGTFPLMNESLNEPIRLRYETPDGQQLAAIQQSYLFPANRVVTLTFGLEQKIADEYLDQERRYLERPMYYILGFSLLLLLGIAALVSCLATAPITAVRKAIAAVQSGKETRIQGDFPSELAVLIGEMNRLLDYLSNALTRSRTFAANLSHSLRTPLTVIRNEPISPLAREKTDTILRLVDRNLARISAAGSGEILGIRTEIKPVVDRVLNGYSRMYPIETEIIAGQGQYFIGDEVDLIELLGNVIENACRFASSRVRVEIENETIVVEDDGPGIPAEHMGDILARGCRLDDATDGTGIGLAIAKDIVELYSGRIELSTSNIGGLKVTIALPIGR